MDPPLTLTPLTDGRPPYWPADVAECADSAECCPGEGEGRGGGAQIEGGENFLQSQDPSSPLSPLQLPLPLPRQPQVQAKQPVSVSEPQRNSAQLERR